MLNIPILLSVFILFNTWFDKVKENMEGGHFVEGIRELITSSFFLNWVNPKVIELGESQGHDQSFLNIAMWKVKDFYSGCSINSDRLGSHHVSLPEEPGFAGAAIKNLPGDHFVCWELI